MGKKDEILQTMLSIVNEFGLTGATISKLSKKANISPGIIYHYFETKENILQTLFSMIEQEFIEEIQAESLLELPLFECYKTLWIKVFYFCTKNPDKMFFLELYRNSPFFKSDNSSFREDFLKKLQNRNLQSIKKKELRDLPIEAIYTMTGKVAQDLAKLQISNLHHFSKVEIDDIASTVCRSIFQKI